MYILTADREHIRLSETLVSQSILFANMNMECESKTTLRLGIDKQQVVNLEAALKGQYDTCELRHIFDLVNICDFLCIDSIMPTLLSNLINKLNTCYLRESMRDDSPLM